ncbi:MAG TPA: membrane dipeptidase [Steroidobacteraceae bacterium]|nr:membrane dipeptidase [Steroidobacteraceae bacterium]
MNRREFAAAGTAAVLATALEPGTVAAAPPKTTFNPPLDRALRWAPYEKTISIDGLAGLGRMGGTGGPPLSEAELGDARESGMTALRFSLAPQGAFWFDDAAFRRTLDEISAWDQQIIARPDVFSLILKGADLQRAQRERKLGIIYGFQETSPIGEDLERIELFHKRGVRVIQLTHNRRNLVGDGCMEPGNAGLSVFGHKVIDALEQHKIVVDLSHAGRRTTSEAIAASKRPLLIGHTGCAALSDLPRCVTDESLRAMADKGGAAGIIFWPYLRKDTQPMAIDVIRHIEHAINVCGEDHVGLGTDSTLSAIERTPEFEKMNREMVEGMIKDGIFEAGRPLDLYTFIPDLNHVRRFEMLAAMLSARGHPDARIAKVLGGNFARVMSEVWG